VGRQGAILRFSQTPSARRTTDIGGGQQTSVVRRFGRKEQLVLTLLAVVVCGLALAMGVALHDLQLRLERWDYERHAND
jgi:hypothetical protein